MGRRILALDPGTKRIGVALSDELGWTAQPLETFERRSIKADVQHIQELVHRHEVGRVVMGLPVRLDGRIGPAAESVHQFIDILQEALNVPVVTWDERLTSKAAEDLLIQANVSRKKRKGAVDRIAAALLLQSYLANLPSEEEAQGTGGVDGNGESTSRNGSLPTSSHDA
jgi:putative Holliday junction resolvase